ncbi:MAG TPA: class I SAM-dependent methyltransferase [Thermoanaerobaculia bacterium]|nr:class I SAM-dependent methyltransferase [Thermoanaerobaculia bacterium]
MTVWNDAAFSERLAHTNWMANTAVLMHLNERATGDPARDWLSSWAHRWFAGDDLRVLVLGCGEGWLERAVAEWPFVARIDAVDFAEHAVARARELARGISKIEYGVVDLNRDVLPEGAYDVVVAHSVLHHVENLEHAYAQLERTMRPNATLIVNEYVGPNRFQYSDDVLSIMNALLRALPFELRRPYERRTRPTVEEMIANDPTEAVRAEELMAFTARTFEVLETKELGGAVVQHLLFDIVQNFRFDDPRERSLVELLCTIDAMLTDARRIPCDFLIAAARKKGAMVTKAARPLPPRTEQANDVEPDPLRRIPLASRVLKGGGLDEHQRRLLRVALLSQNPRRANLFAEDARLGPFGRARDWKWLLAQAPDDPAIRLLLETAAAILAPT